MDTGLVIVPAGAGAGKTHRIKTQLSDWVRRGIVRPERILAVTFTEAAAGELRERIRAGLLADGLVREAMAVERAYVSTIHGLGLRLLSEHALAAGASPQPRHLGETERDLLIRQALAQAKALDPIKAEPERYGYTPSWQKGETVEDALRARVLQMIDLLRGLGDTGQDPQLIAPALGRLDQIYGKLLPDPQAARKTLLAAISAMVKAFPQGGMAGIKTDGPRKALEADLELFSLVLRKPQSLDQDWRLWQKLRQIFTSNSKSKTPEGYDSLADAIRSAADVLPEHPGPLADAKLHLHCLIACAQEVMEAYDSRKKALGLIDYTDMICGAERLLRCDPAVRQAVLDEIDCVIIDEFQDTNPVQFALLWQLGAHAPRTLLVGDVKQSIMGFQGADPRLSQALAAANPQAIQPLDRNWRSTPAVMDFVNAMGQGLFGASYNALAPTRAAVPSPALELLHVKEGRLSRKASKPPEHMAEQIATILIRGETVTDRKSGIARPVRPSDIALLVCRHTTATRYAEELRARGVPVRISEDGWAKSPAVLAARAALAFAANPADIHSGLILRTLGPDPLPLQAALAAQIEARLADDPVLMRLAGLSDRLLHLPITAVLELVFKAAGLHDWADRHADAGQARADLLRLEAEAEAFETAHRDMRAAAGFHGDTAKVFLGWLDAQSRERDFDRRPDPSANSAEAVEIVTWHGSKGREWPITVVAEFDYRIEERPFTTSARFDALDRIDDMSAVLASAALIHTPGFAAPEAERRFIEDQRQSFEANAKNLLYVALTRARDRLVLEWPDFLTKREPELQTGANCLFHIFADCCAVRIGSESLRIGAGEYAVECPAKHYDLPAQAGLSSYRQSLDVQTPRFGAASPLAEVELSPWRQQPSLIRSHVSAPSSRAVEIGAPWPQEINDAARGTALHLALRTCLTRPALLPELAGATGLDQSTLSMVATRASELQSWLAARGYQQLWSELALHGQTAEGAEISGSIDLLAIGPAGALLIDHKSGGCGEGFGPYWPQLTAYMALLEKCLPQYPLVGVGIFWIDHGRLDLAGLDAPALQSPI